MDKIDKQKDLSCLALFILTHGEKKGTIYTYDDELNLNKDIIDSILPTKCKQLAGKPVEHETISKTPIRSSNVFSQVKSVWKNINLNKQKHKVPFSDIFPFLLAV